MSNFESKTLGRTFETIYFGTLEQEMPAPALARAGANPHPVVSSAPSADSIVVTKAPGITGKTIAELISSEDGCTIPIRDARRWTPDDPFLYEFTVELFQGDRVTGYFGMR